MPRIPDPTAVYGVDLSAAAASAGADTWVARCFVDDGTLVVDELASAAEFLGLGSTARDDVLPALSAHLGGVDGPAVAGVDVPFSLPAWVLGDRTWREFVAATPGEWGVLDAVDDPRDLYDAVREAADADAGRPIRRATDDAHGGQDPAGFRIKTQTYYGISVLLRRLIEREGVCVPPALPASALGGTAGADGDQLPRLAVLETYPASVFDRLDGAERTGYKKAQRRHVEARRRNVAALVDDGVRFADDAARDCAVATDDALDAVAAASAAERNYQTALDPDDGSDRTERLEGRIYG
ncbi:DUF429 domain-containing protein [Halobaculum sp. WSA2]|uniref:DUF429 domain-containing protein n=1 Tax=Halobaculum saliterrae TaxID=2073113 RepID=A0A6B0SS08_9EURY|nr:DUF429 domain-containing protein [Halobaculum saliterrae]MXR41317.1 DUF429 domain-containing protein [Halobaculum saliterrae]